MPRARRVCNVHRCPKITASSTSGRCAEHEAKADRDRGTPAERGYATRGHRRGFRLAVLDAAPICQVCALAASTVADHFPLSRRELFAQGLDPDDPRHGRGLCKRCHDRETARLQPGGWNAR